MNTDVTHHRTRGRHTVETYLVRFNCLQKIYVFPADCLSLVSPLIVLTPRTNRPEVFGTVRCLKAVPALVLRHQIGDFLHGRAFV
jgi:hypothetical protein